MIELTAEAERIFAELGLRLQILPNQQVWVHNTHGEQLFVAEPPSADLPDVFVVRWFHYARGQEIINIVRHVALPMYKRQGSQPKMLNDSYFSEGPRDVIEELSRSILSLWVQAGLRFSAMVMPLDMFAKMSVDNLVAEVVASASLTIRPFGTEVDARNWLLSLPSIETSTQVP